MLGILNILKPLNVTSRDVVTKIVHTVRCETGQKIKAGHAGTLDPQASGVLVVCLGKATKLIQFVQRSAKTYQARFRVDVSSASVDLETPVEPIADPVQPSRDQIEAVLPQFLGKIQQTPPAYSAVSINGQRAYKLARKGVEVEIKPKTVEIHSMNINSYAYPDLEMTISCGSGTYIRSLGRDLAQAVGSDAVMTELVRTAIGNFKLEQALPMDAISFESLHANLGPPLQSVIDLVRIELSDEEQRLIQTGRFLEADRFGIDPDQAPQIAATDSDGILVAVLEWRQDQLKPLINLT